MALHASGKLRRHPFLMAEVQQKTGIIGQGVPTETHPGVAEQPIAARIVVMNAPTSPLRGPCQSSDPRLRLVRKSWMRGLPAGLHWRLERVPFAAWKPCRETTVPKVKNTLRETIEQFLCQAASSSPSNGLFALLGRQEQSVTGRSAQAQKPAVQLNPL
jgi:hypothetical protein